MVRTSSPLVLYTSMEKSPLVSTTFMSSISSDFSLSRLRFTDPNMLYDKLSGSNCSLNTQATNNNEAKM